MVDRRFGLNYNVLTEMNKPTFFLTEVAQDWSEKNLTVIQESIVEAERATLARTDVRADPLLEHPTLPSIAGESGGTVQKHLAMAAERVCSMGSRGVGGVGRVLGP